MADLILDWGRFGAATDADPDVYGVDITDAGATVDTGGVAVTVASVAQDAGAAAFTFSADGYVATGEPFDVNSHLKLFGEGGDDGGRVSATSTTTMTFASTDEDFTDEVQNVAFRLNDVDTGFGEDIDGAGGGSWQDILTINAYDAEGNLVPVTLTSGTDPMVTGQTVTGTVTTDFIGEDGSVLVNIEGPVSRIEFVYENGSDSQQGLLISDVHFSTVDVTDPNQDPIAVDDTDTTDDVTPITIDVLSNDSDPDGDPLTVTSAVPVNGSVTINGDGTLAYTPAPGFFGDDTISYVISDGNGGTATADVIVTITDGNLPPDAVDDTATTAGAPITVPFLANDSDPEGGTLTVTAIDAPANGTLVDNGDGTLTYTPDAGFVGTETIGYTISDPLGDSDSATITITVTDPGTGPDGYVDGTGGDDLIYTNDPTDRYTGDPNGDFVDSNDALLPGEGPQDDIIRADSGNDTVIAGDGDDEILAGEGNDSVEGGDGNDSIIGEEGNDTIFGGDGSDTVRSGDDDDVIDTGGSDPRIDTDVFPVSAALQPVDPLDGADEDPDPEDDRDYVDAGAGNDTITTGDDRDTIFGGSGDDVIEGGIDDDYIDGHTGNDLITDIQGADTVTGGQGDDTITVGIDTFMDDFDDNPVLTALGFTADPNPDDGRDSVEGNQGNDVIMTGDDDDTIDGGADDDYIDAGIDEDFVMGALGNDTIYGRHGSDTLDGGGGDDLIDGRIDAAYELTDDVDTLPENDRDSMQGGQGNDTIYGGDDDDTLDGGQGNDLLYGGIDEDLITGNQGNDTIYGGQGADTMTGGEGRDVFIIDGAGDGIGDTIDGGSTPTGLGADGLPLDYDTLDLRGSAPTGGGLRVTYTSADREDGYVTYYDDTGAAVGRTDFEEIENVVPCFTPGTMIATPIGERLVEDLKEGDRIITRDNGIQEIRWIGQKTLTGHDLARAPHMRPILIQAGSLGPNLPEHDMLVSPNHRMLVNNDKTALYFEDREVLAAAKHLTGLKGVDEVGTLGVTYIHFMFDQHEVVLSNGAWSESFQPGDYTLEGIGNAQRNEILELFPELRTKEGLEGYTAARRSLKKHEAKLLVK